MKFVNRNVVIDSSNLNKALFFYPSSTYKRKRNIKS